MSIECAECDMDLKRHCLTESLGDVLWSYFFFFTDTATTEIYTLSLHDALPIFLLGVRRSRKPPDDKHPLGRGRSEEHTSELQSQFHLVCRLLLEKKKKINI